MTPPTPSEETEPGTLRARVDAARARLDRAKGAKDTAEYAAALADYKAEIEAFARAILNHQGRRRAAGEDCATDPSSSGS